ncbi:DUF4185 domain-containing protein [Proteiniphilum acetatigenes]|uniref:DUF4185 domain-containing protein n=1 Tax=Proteiniphilum acetatigenes TaxID=294710 RepID=UPI0012F71604|nr:DUF4185 domain-containing protein [Proteiniphilum acetatigenes]
MKIGLRLIGITLLMVFYIVSCNNANQDSNSNQDSKNPAGIDFKRETIKRVGHTGDNWCMTWLKDGNIMVSMDDGDWLNEGQEYHHNVYRLKGGKNDFTISEVPNYPKFKDEGEGWFGYGIYSVNGVIYSFVSRTQNDRWSGPFRGMKLLKSTDNGETWYRVNRYGETRLIDPMDEEAKEDISENEMFFWEEYGLYQDGQIAYPFSYCAFVEHGQDNKEAKDDYLYIYSPEGAQAHRLLLARVKNTEIEIRDNWEYFSGWDNGNPTWSKNIEERDAVHVFPQKNGKNEYFGWYSWLPSVVWNPGLSLYIMTSGGTYGGHRLTDSAKDYYDAWMHTKTGSLGFWYSENAYGPWKEFYYTDYWVADDKDNLTYQPKLSPKWISEDGTEMVLVWSDAMKDETGKTHAINYLWNQMDVVIKLNK